MNQSHPLVSIIMNCLNGERYLHEAVDSIINQTYSKWELIFWDNNSSDQSANIILGYNDERIHYFKTDSTVALGCARNLALEKINGKYISFLDCDDLWEPVMLEELVNLLQNNESYGLAFGDSYHFDETGIIKNHFHSFDIQTIDLKKISATKNLLLKGCFIDIEAVLIRSNLIKQLHGFNPLLAYAEDYDLWLKLGLICDFVVSQKVLARWRIHKSQSTNMLKLRKYEEQLFLMLKYMPYLNSFNEKAIYWKKILGEILRYMLKGEVFKFFSKMKNLYRGFKYFEAATGENYLLL